MPTLFTKIINQELPSYKIYEDDYTYVFLSIHPLYEGHTLVVPKQEIDKRYHNDNQTLHRLMDTAKYIAEDLEVVFEAERVAMIIEGLEVSHTHIHLVPLPVKQGLKNSKPSSPTDDALQIIHQRIIQHLNK